MDILQSIGINSTAGIQFVIFVIAIFFLNKFVFTSYAHAAEERLKRTKGGEDLALEFQKKAIELQSVYELKAREINDQIKSIVDEAKGAANKQYESTVSAARDQATTLTNENRSKVLAAFNQASVQLKEQTSTMAMAITNKLLGK